MGFAIDDTGRMSVEIGAARTALNNYSSGHPSRIYDLEVTGDNTNFDSSTTAYFTDGGGITVTDVSVSDNTHALARSISPTTPPLGYRNLTLETGSETASMVDAFQVVAVRQDDGGGGGGGATGWLFLLTAGALALLRRRLR